MFLLSHQCFLSLLQSKDTTDSRSRGASNTSNRGGRGGTDRYGVRSGAAYFTSNGIAYLHISLVFVLVELGNFYILMNLFLLYVSLFVFCFQESGPLQSKPAYKKENGTHGYAGSSSSAAGVVANNMNQRPPFYRLLLLKLRSSYKKGVQQVHINLSLTKVLSFLNLVTLVLNSHFG